MGQAVNRMGFWGEKISFGHTVFEMLHQHEMSTKFQSLGFALEDRTARKGLEWLEFIMGAPLDRGSSLLHCDFREGPLQGVQRNFCNSSFCLVKIMSGRDGAK